MYNVRHEYCSVVWCGKTCS